MVLTFGLIIALCTSFMVKLTTGTFVMFQGAISKIPIGTSKESDQQHTGKP